MELYWVITVRDPGDQDAGIPSLERRFEFVDLQEAYECARRAHEAGFVISARKVATTKVRVSA